MNTETMRTGRRAGDDDPTRVSRAVIPASAYPEDDDPHDDLGFGRRPLFPDERPAQVPPPLPLPEPRPSFPVPRSRQRRIAARREEVTVPAAVIIDRDDDARGRVAPPPAPRAQLRVIWPESGRYAVTPRAPVFARQRQPTRELSPDDASGDADHAVASPLARYHVLLVLCTLLGMLFGTALGLLLAR